MSVHRNTRFQIEECQTLLYSLSIITHSYWLPSFHTHCFNIHLLSSSSISNFLNMLWNNFFFFWLPEDNHYLPIIVFSGKYHNLLPKQEKQTNQNALFVSHLSLLCSTLLWFSIFCFLFAYFKSKSRHLI